MLARGAFDFTSTILHKETEDGSSFVFLDIIEPCSAGRDSVPPRAINAEVAQTQVGCKHSCTANLDLFIFLQNGSLQDES
jgi:hypothetical protein